MSQEFEHFLKSNGIHHPTSAPYHPASNGLAERAVQTVKKGLKKEKSGNLTRLAKDLLAYRITPQSTTRYLQSCCWGGDLERVLISSSQIQRRGLRGSSRSRKLIMMREPDRDHSVWETQYLPKTLVQERDGCLGKL